MECLCYTVCLNFIYFINGTFSDALVPPRKIVLRWTFRSDHLILIEACGPAINLHDSKNLVCVILIRPLREPHLSLMILTCYPTLNFTLPTRTRDRFLFIRAHISSTCLSVTASGDIPRAQCTLLYALRNRWSTSRNLYVFL